MGYEYRESDYQRRHGKSDCQPGGRLDYRRLVGKDRYPGERTRVSELEGVAPVDVRNERASIAFVRGSVRRAVSHRFGSAGGWSGRRGNVGWLFGFGTQQDLDGGIQGSEDPVISPAAFFEAEVLGLEYLPRRDGKLANRVDGNHPHSDLVESRGVPWYTHDVLRYLVADRVTEPTKQR